MKNKNKTIWSSRFKSKVSLSFQKIGSSINVDKRLYEQDIMASIVHTQMLIKQKIIKSEDGNKIINGLKKIKTQIDKGQFNFQEKFEDIHLNIEKKLFEIIGPAAGYLHTARSRNDQVVTDFKLWIKKSTREILKDIIQNRKVEDFMVLRDIIIETNSIKFTQDKAKEFVSAAKENLKVVENSEIGSLLNFLAEFSINRKK